MTADIVILPINESYLRLIASPSVSNELSEHFTFFAPNYQFAPLFKQRVWDGKIRNFKAYNGEIYRGLKDEVLAFARNNAYSVEDLTGDADTEFSYKEAFEFVKSLNIPQHMWDFGPDARDYQIKYFTKAIRKHRLTFLSPTGSGKSFIIYLIIRWLLANGYKKGVLIVPTTALVEQMFGDFDDYAVEDSWNSEDYCYKVYSGKEKRSPKKLMITTWQTLQNMDEEFLKQFDFVIGDEAHTFQAKSLIGIMSNLVNARVRISATGTLDGLDSSTSTIVGLFGPVSQLVRTHELMERGVLADLEIKFLILKYDAETCKRLRKLRNDGKKKNEKTFNYNDEVDFLVGNQNRNNFIKNLALSLEGNTLILFHLVEKHGKGLFDLIKSNAPEGRNVYYIDGNASTEYREYVRKRLEMEDNSIVIASFGVLRMGTNIRNLHNAIFASFSKKRIRNLQSIGRVLRPHKSKDKATLFDIADDLQLGSDPNYSVKHYEARREIYAEEKFKVRTYSIQLKGPNDATKSKT